MKFVRKTDGLLSVKNVQMKLSQAKDQDNEIKDLKEKYETLNAYADLADSKVDEVKAELTKAKEIIRNLLRVTYGEGWNYSLDWKVKAEQLLKEIEND